MRFSKLGTTEAAAIILDDDIDETTPTAPRSARPRVSSVILRSLPVDDVVAALLERGRRRETAAPDGNCAQRAIKRSVKFISSVEANSCDARAISWISDDRHRIVDRIAGSGAAFADGRGSVGLSELRQSLGLPRDTKEAEQVLAPFRRVGHWDDTGPAFALFLWGIADDLQCPVAVLERRISGGEFDDPVCIYRPQAPGDHAPRRGAGSGVCCVYTYIPFAELLCWLDQVLARPDQRIAVVELVPGHFSPFV